MTAPPGSQTPQPLRPLWGGRELRELRARPTPFRRAARAIQR